MELETLSHEFRSGCLQELSYDDDHVLIAVSMEELIAESMQGLIEKFKKWKEGMETNGQW